MKNKNISQTFLTLGMLALLASCASKGGGGEEMASSGTDELESLAASIDSGGGKADSSSESEMQISENDLMDSNLKDSESSAKEELSLDDSSDSIAEDLSLDDTLAAEDRSVADSGKNWSGSGLAITSSGSSIMPLSDTPWLEEATANSLGFSCKWKTLKNNGKVRHRVCSVEKQVVVNVLEKNRGSGLQLAKLVFDQKGKAGFNRWKKSLKEANYKGGKEKTKKSGSKFARYMSPDHRSFVDLIWNGNSNAATLIMTPSAKGLGRELKKVAGF